MTANLAHLIWAWAGTALFVIVGLWALLRGGRTERYGVGIIAAGWIITPLVQTHPVIWPDPGAVVVDSVVFAALLALSLTSRKLWTLFATAFQMDTLAAHAAIWLSPQIGGFSYYTSTGLYGGYYVVFALAAGIIACERQRRLSKALL